MSDKNDDYRRCPDDGRCWHHCAADECFRVRACLPFSNHNGNGRWSEDEKARFGRYPTQPSIEDVIIRGVL